MRRFLILILLAGLSGAQDEYRLRVAVDLVQVDAMVTDARGDAVPDLKAGDFRVLLDGKPQELKYCNFVRVNDAPAVPLPAEQTAATASRPAMPAEPIRREEVRRTIVLFVGDLLTSSESIPAIRTGLKKFVQEQMRPGDLAAIVRSGAGLGALQDFTTDRQMLMAAIDQVRWSTNAVGIGGASAYRAMGQPGLQGIGALDLAQLDKIDSIERATLATTWSLLKVVRGMAQLPGRKSLIILSDGLRLTSPDEMDPFGNTATGSGAFLAPIYKSMRERRGRIGARGRGAVRHRYARAVVAAGHRIRPACRIREPTSSARRDEYRDNQWGGMFISSQTGGFMVTEANHIDAALARVMADQRGYYLLAFQPPAEAMQPGANGAPVYHQLKIETVRPGLTVRSHAGFFGVAGEVPGAPPVPQLQLSQPLESAGGIRLDVEAGYLPGKSEFLRTTVYIDGNDVLFQGPPIHRTGVLHLIVKAFNANGGMLPGGIDQTRRIDLDEAGYERAQKYGLIYTALLPAPKPGPYRVRVACRDEATGKSGMNSDFVSIPERKGRALRLSGIVFQHDLGTDESHPAGHYAPGVLRRPACFIRGSDLAGPLRGRPVDADPPVPERRPGLGKRAYARGRPYGRRIVRSAPGTRSGQIPGAGGSRRQGGGQRARMAMGKADFAVAAPGYSASRRCRRYCSNALRPAFVKHSRVCGTLPRYVLDTSI